MSSSLASAEHRTYVLFGMFMTHCAAMAAGTSTLMHKYKKLQDVFKVRTELLIATQIFSVGIVAHIVTLCLLLAGAEMGQLVWTLIYTQIELCMIPMLWLVTEAVLGHADLVADLVADRGHAQRI